tara:strand:+ start:174 stop:1379 length:1206 start_codon:yes stop_codon:yes gene_type:complete
MIPITHLKDSETFCLLPFMHTYGSANGNLVLCCEAQEYECGKGGKTFNSRWNSKEYKDVRKALIDGVKHNACHVCWHNEDNNIESNRQLHTEQHWEEFAPLIQLNDDYTVSNQPVWFELKIGNFCNLACRMCSTHSSYKRAQDIDIIGKYSGFDNQETKLVTPDDLFAILQSDLDWTQVKRLQFTGGEPIINEMHYDLLYSIPKEYRHTIRLRYATNLTHLKYKQHDLIDIWKEFKHVNIKVSMDGAGDIYNYIRLGGDFDTVANNMNTLRQVDNVDIAVGLTIQVYNVFALPEFFDFINKTGINFSFVGSFLLQTPNYLNISVFPQDLKELICKKLSNYTGPVNIHRHDNFDTIINYMQNNNNERLWKKKTLPYTTDLEARHKSTTFNNLLKKYLNYETS